MFSGFVLIVVFAATAPGQSVSPPLTANFSDYKACRNALSGVQTTEKFTVAYANCAPRSAKEQDPDFSKLGRSE